MRPGFSVVSHGLAFVATALAAISVCAVSQVDAISSTRAEVVATELLNRIVKLIQNQTPSHILYRVKNEHFDRLGVSPLTYYEIGKVRQKKVLWVSAEGFKSRGATKGNFELLENGRIVRGTVGSNDYLTKSATTDDEAGFESFNMYSGLLNARDSLQSRKTGKHPATISEFASSKNQRGHTRLKFQIDGKPNWYMCEFDDKNYNLSRYEQHIDNDAIRLVCTAEYATSEGIDYPCLSILESFSKNLLKGKMTCTVDHIEFSARRIPDAIFQIDLPKTAVIHDADRGQIIRNTPDAEEQLKEIASMIGRPRPTWPYWLIGLLVVLFSGYLLYRRRPART